MLPDIQRCGHERSDPRSERTGRQDTTESVFGIESGNTRRDVGASCTRGHDTVSVKDTPVCG